MHLVNLLVFVSSALSNNISRLPSLTNLSPKFSIWCNLYPKFWSLSVKTNTSRRHGNHIIKVGMGDISKIPTIFLKTRDISILFRNFFPSLQILGIYAWYFMSHDVVLTNKMIGIFLCVIIRWYKFSNTLSCCCHFGIKVGLCGRAQLPSGIDRGGGGGGGIGDISPPIFDKGDGLCNHPPNIVKS